MSSVRWLLVGAGDIARKRVAPALSAAGGSELAGVCDLNRNAAVALAREYGSNEVFVDFDTALADTAANAVYLATPVQLHVDQAVRAMESGKHVIVEKPLGLSGDQCSRAVEVGERTGVKAACAYFRRFSPRYLHAKEMVESGSLGQVISVRMTYQSSFNPAPDDPKYWRVVRAKSGGGALADMGSHMFDLLLGLFGMPVSVYALCENLVRDWDVEDSAAILMKLPNGALVTAGFNWNSATWKHEFEIAGTAARLHWLPFDTGPVVKTVGREVESVDLPTAGNVHLPLVEDFIQAVIEDRSPVCGLGEAARVNRLLDAVYRSSRENREVRMV